MYSIGNIIYGVPLNRNQYNYKQPLIIERAIEDEIPGFLSYYNGGGGDIPSAFGIEIGEFDCCCHHTELTSLTLKPTVEQVAQFNTLLANKDISDKLRDAILQFGEPRVFFLWSSS